MRLFSLSLFRRSSLLSDDLYVLLIQWFETVKFAAQLLVYLHNSCIVVEFSAVVGSREYRNEITLTKELVSILYHLMRSAN
jgi:hypothetical protein